MPRITRKREIPARTDEIWRLISDPYNLPRWWPRTARVESVEPGAGGGGAEWTSVLETDEGRGVRADCRCVARSEGERYAWEQRVGGTPFARHLRRAGVEIALRPVSEGTEVGIRSSQALRGLSRLGSPMMRRAQAAMLEEALDGIEQALGGDPK
jgi:uncharacterized protein YndB with AHSA1/START domain